MSSTQANSLRITMVTLNLEVGGLERVVVDMSLALAAQGHQLSLVTLRGGGPLAGSLEAAGIAVHSLNCGDGLKPTTASLLATTLRKLAPDLVHSHGEAALFYCGLGRLLPGFLPFGGPAFAHVHSRHGYEDVSSRGRLRNRLAHLGCDAVVCVSADLARHCEQIERVPAGRLYTVINGVNLTPYRLLPHPPFAAGAPVVGHVARLAPVKNQALLLSAFALLVARMPAAQLSIVGDGPERGRLQQLSAELGIDQQVLFHGETSDVPGKLADTHLFCLTSDSEGTPVSVIEALAAGRPIVATDVGGLAALVPATAGRLVPRGDAQAIADGIAKVFASAEAYASFCEGARSAPAGELDSEAMLQSYQDIYQQAWSRFQA